MRYFVRDIAYLQQIVASEEGRVPIEINFEAEFGHPLSCLPMPMENEDYDSYLAIIPGSVLARMYHVHGARLLEQNVRAFLQFTGKINKGIRDTVVKEPHMFFAYNDGIAGHD